MKDDDKNNNGSPAKEENGEYKVTVTREDEINGNQAISGQIYPFHFVSIIDGVNLYVHSVRDQSGALIPSPYILKDGYLLIKQFYDYDEDEYSVTPYIQSLSPVGSKDDGNGEAWITVFQSESGSLEQGNYRKRIQWIHYVITPNDENE